jgi:hypothetical protein
MEKIKSLLLPLLAPLLAALKPLIKVEIENKIIGPLEQYILKSENKIDDAIGLPIIAKARELLAAF